MATFDARNPTPIAIYDFLGANGYRDREADQSGFGMVAPYYASSLMISESNHSVRRGPPSYTSYGTGATIMSSAWDGSVAPSSVSTRPPRQGPQATYPQRPGVSVSIGHSSGSAPLRGTIPCEFHQWAGCAEIFSPYDVDGWVRHVEDVHLHYNYPMRSICWICDRDDGKFECAPHDPNRREVFYSRIEHIAGHFVNEWVNANKIRPDFHLLEHVYKEGLIDVNTFQAAKAYSEVLPKYSAVLENPSKASPRTSKGGSRRHGHRHAGESSR